MAVPNLRDAGQDVRAVPAGTEVRPVTICDDVSNDVPLEEEERERLKAWWRAVADDDRYDVTTTHYGNSSITTIRLKETT